jgi:molybdopterin/thiamine biosynthesis adenylyltransferase
MSRKPDSRSTPRRPRLPQFLGAPPGFEAALDRAKVVLVGSGSVGGCIALHLARLQLKEIFIIDPGCFKGASRWTHCVPSGAKGSKAHYWARQCKQISPYTQVGVFDGPVQLAPAAAFAAADIVVISTDNLPAEDEVGQRCVNLAKPLFQASVHGETMTAHVRFWRNRDGQGPCPHCGYNEEEIEHLNTHTLFRCGKNNAVPVVGEVQPTASTSFLCSMAADLLMTQVLRFVLGLGREQHDSILEYCGYTHNIVVSPLTRRADCPCEHRAWKDHTVTRLLAECSLRELAHEALGDGGLPPHGSFVVGDGLLFVEAAACCGEVVPVRRFCRAGDTVAQCGRCGAALHPQSYYAHRPVPLAVLAGLLDEPLLRLGAADPAWVLVDGGDEAVFCHQEKQEKRP